jgi:dihydroflavonol-4-reductase
MDGSTETVALVTGASGFVGAAVVRALLRRNRRVRALVRARSDRRNLAGLDVELREGSLEDAASLRDAVQGAAELFHVAADYRLWVPDPAAMFRANVDGTRALMEAALAAGIGRIVYTSSVATLGTVAGERGADETTPSSFGDMVGPYKQSKFLAEEAVRGMIAERGLPAVIVNPSTPVGPGDVKPTPTGKLILDAASGRMPGFVDTGLNIVHVDDVAEGHLLALERGVIGERYLLGGDNLSLAQILAEIAALTGRRAPRLRLPIAPLIPLAFAAELVARATGTEPFVTRDALKLAEKRMFFSSEKAKRALGYAPRPASQALADAVAWFGQAGYLKRMPARATA